MIGQPDTSETSREFSTPEELYSSVLHQVERIAHQYLAQHPNGLKLGNSVKMAETVHVSIDTDGPRFSFDTHDLNIAVPGRKEGAYPNTFVFTFAPEGINITYEEALPRREQTVNFNTGNFSDVQSAKERLTMYVKAFNELLTHFNISEQVTIPS